MSPKKKEWKLVRNTWISNKPVLPGVWERKEGGHAVRARAKDGATGHLKEIWKVLPEADAPTALKWLTDETASIRSGRASAPPQQTRFAEFAASLFEHKVRVGDIRSAKGRDKWADILEHLITGTTGKKAGKHVEAFGEMFLDRIHVTHVEAWKGGIAELIAAGDYAPTTANGWLSVLRVVLKAAKRQHELRQLATDGVENFDESEHVVYSEEDPNALLPAEVGPFFARLRELHPAHFAMTYLALVTGLRPSSLRPLRRRGAEADVDWEHDRIRVRRSHTMGEEVMRTTKQRRRYAIDLPEEAMQVLRWHVETQLATPEQQASDLLFPSTTGGFRAPTVLNKPLADVAAELELGKRFTQCGLRRTFNDLARAAQVGDLVTRSISGHLTERMQHHYSTVSGSEQREALTRVVRLVQPARREDGQDAPPGGEHGGEHSPGGGEQKEKAS
jgi:integrase